VKKNKKTKEEIEVIDIFDELPKKSKSKSNTKKRKLKKVLLFQVVFSLLSIVFIIGCCIFYGSRLIKFYKIYNPKDENGKAIELLGNHILNNSSFVYEGEGIYLINGSNIYKGENVNNYIKYSNLLWRILRINEDKSLEIVL